MVYMQIINYSYFDIEKLRIIEIGQSTHTKLCNYDRQYLPFCENFDFNKSAFSSGNGYFLWEIKITKLPTFLFKNTFTLDQFCVQILSFFNLYYHVIRHYLNNSVWV
jgi:hypothetical protein